LIPIAASVIATTLGRNRFIGNGLHFTGFREARISAQKSHIDAA